MYLECKRDDKQARLKTGTSCPSVLEVPIAGLHVLMSCHGGVVVFCKVQQPGGSFLHTLVNCAAFNVQPQQSATLSGSHPLRVERYADSSLHRLRTDTLWFAWPGACEADLDGVSMAAVDGMGWCAQMNVSCGVASVGGRRLVSETLAHLITQVYVLRRGRCSAAGCTSVTL